MLLAPWEVKRGRKFCSRTCHYEYRKGKGTIIPDFTKKKYLSYILGVLLGDGYVTKSCRKYPSDYTIGLTCCERDFTLSFMQALKEINLHPNLQLIKRKKPKHRNVWRTHAYSNEFGNWYKSLSIVDIEKIVMEGDLKEFIRGFYESEGTNAKNGIQFSNTNYEIISFVKKIIEEEGFKTSFHERKKEKEANEYTLRILGGANECNRFISKIKPVIKNEIRKITPIKVCNFSKEEIENLYFNPELTISEISKRLYCSETIFYKYLNKFAIPLRGHKFYKYVGKKNVGKKTFKGVAINSC